MIFSGVAACSFLLVSTNSKMLGLCLLTCNRNGPSLSAIMMTAAAAADSTSGCYGDVTGIGRNWT